MALCLQFFEKIFESQIFCCFNFFHVSADLDYIQFNRMNRLDDRLCEIAMLKLYRSLPLYWFLAKWNPIHHDFFILHGFGISFAIRAPKDWNDRIKIKKRIFFSPDIFIISFNLWWSKEKRDNKGSITFILLSLLGRLFIVCEMYSLLMIPKGLRNI